MNEKKKEYMRMVKFFFFSTSAGIIQIVSFTLMNELLQWKYWPCYLISLILSIIWNFTLNRKFTFQSANNIPLAMTQVALFYCVFTPVTTIGGNYLAETLLWNEYLVTGLNMVLNLITEYLYQRYVVFGKSIDTNKKAQDKEEELKNE